MRSRESRYVRMTRLAYALTLKTLPQYSHPKSPHHFTLPPLAACVLLLFYLNLSYHDLEEWLLATDAVIVVLSLPRIPSSDRRLTRVLGPKMITIRIPANR